jgi:hypothetical protein
MKKLLVGVVIGAFLLAASVCWAEIPHMINYQGMLTSDAGDPLNGSYDLNFKIYGSESGDDSLWWEYHSGVTVTEGLFNVILGGTNPIPASIFDDTVRYFGITVGANPELSPRIRLTSMAYAYRALVADSAAVAGSGTGGAGGWVDDGSVVRLETSTDSVGIGTDSPGDKLEVADGSMNARLCCYKYTSFPSPYEIWSGVRGTYGGDVEGFLGRRYYKSLSGNTYYGVYGSATTTGNNYGVFGSASGGSTNWAGFFDGDVHASGKVGIGTETPGVKLHIEGGGDAKVLTPNTGYLIIGSCTEPHIAMDNNEILAKSDEDSIGHLYIQWSTEAKTLMHGKVGIGTDSPSERLDVEGNIDVSDSCIKNYHGFPKPDYNSGWYIISQGETKTFTHNLYGDYNDYVVDVMFNSATGHHQAYYGGDQYDPDVFDALRGAYWSSLTSTQIKVIRHPNDASVNEVRVRIWVIRD